MHTLTFLEPGHFHATLTLRAAHAALSPEVFVYATAGPELDDFLALVERFNRRAERPTRWRPRGQSRPSPSPVSSTSGRATWWCWPAATAARLG